MELSEYLSAIKNHWRRGIAIVIGCVLIATALSLLLPRTYEATTSLFVSTQVDQTNLNQQLLQGGNFTTTRVKSYIDLGTAPSVLDPVLEQLNLPLTTRELSEKVTVTAPADTVLLDVAVTDRDPTVAANIANAVAARLSTRITELETPTGQSRSPVKIEAVSAARAPSDSISPNVALNISYGLALGLLLAISTAVVQDKFDTRIKSAESLAGSAKRATLADIPRENERSTRASLRTDAPNRRTAEAFRQLRTNLQFASIDRRPQTILITSANPGEGKSFVAGNLALALSDAGHNVCLVDADLRLPSQQEYFSTPGEIGLTTTLIGRASLVSVIQRIGPKLALVASGTTPPNPSELVDSERTVQVLEELSSYYDFVIVDSPPILPVTDSVALSTKVDGVLLVAQAGKTTGPQIDRAVRALEIVGGTLLGGVLNFTRPIHGYGYGYGYGHGPDKRSNGQRKEVEPNTDKHKDKTFDRVSGSTSSEDGTLSEGMTRPTPRRRS